MSRIHDYRFVITTDATTGGGTATSTYPLNGEVLSVRHHSGNFGGGTADILLTRSDESGGGTILSAANVTGPWEYSPRTRVSLNTDGVGAGTVGYVPLHGQVSCVVTGSTGSTSGTVFLYYRG